MPTTDVGGWWGQRAAGAGELRGSIGRIDWAASRSPRHSLCGVVRLQVRSVYALRSFPRARSACAVIPRAEGRACTKHESRASVAFSGPSLPCAPRLSLSFHDAHMTARLAARRVHLPPPTHPPCRLRPSRPPLAPPTSRLSVRVCPCHSFPFHAGTPLSTRTKHPPHHQRPALPSLTAPLSLTPLRPHSTPRSGHPSQRVVFQRSRQKPLRGLNLTQQLDIGRALLLTHTV